MTKVFKNWCKRIGPAPLAKMLKISRQTVYNWLAGKSTPRPKEAKKMIDMSSGFLEWKDFYEKD